jgi:hypothetical protein
VTLTDIIDFLKPWPSNWRWSKDCWSYVEGGLIVILALVFMGLYILDLDWMGKAASYFIPIHVLSPTEKTYRIVANIGLFLLMAGYIAMLIFKLASKVYKRMHAWFELKRSMLQE